MKTLNMMLILFSVCAGVTGCMAIPIPHKVVPHGAIEGRVVDDRTGKPIEGICISVGQRLGRPEGVTDPNGRFVLEAKEEWRLWYAILLLPADPSLTDRVHLYSDSSAVRHGRSCKTSYRSLSVQVRSWPSSGHPWGTGQRNRELREDLGTLRMKRLPSIWWLHRQRAQ